MNPLLRQPRAVIDVGSNTIHLLVATWDGRRIDVFDDASERTALAADLVLHGAVSDRKLARLTEVAASYASRARHCGAASLEVLATQASRSAPNQAAIVHGLAEATGVPVRVLETQEEACFAALGAFSSVRWAARTAIADIGGGSVQVAVADPGSLIWTASAPIGTAHLGMRLHDARPHEITRLSREIALALREAFLCAGGPPAVGQMLLTGGALRRLFRFLGSPAELRGNMIAAASSILDSADGVALAMGRGVSVRNVPLVRAGALIASALLQEFGLESGGFVSTGMREGAIIARSGLPLPLGGTGRLTGLQARFVPMIPLSQRGAGLPSHTRIPRRQLESSDNRPLVAR